jgi:hypothetical protein
MTMTDRSSIRRVLAGCAGTAALAATLSAQGQVPVPLGGAPAPAAGRPAATHPRPAPGAGPAAPASRPAPRLAPRAGQAVEEPIRCWWKTDRTAVRVGERFAVVLTCASIETGPTTVVPNVSQMEGGAIQLTPFEVVSSTRRADVVTPPRRYVQFEYLVRLLSDGFFGQDVSLPALTVTYNFRTADGANTGRDQTYILPALPMRVLSLVPRAVADIRDTSTMTFGDIEAARFRATVARVASWIALAFAVVFAILALVRASRPLRAKAPGTVKQVGPFTGLGACAAALRDVRAAVSSEGGWSADLARRALPALRLAGAWALGRPVAQEKVRRGVAVREGQILVRRGWLRPVRTVLSASTTPSQIAAAADRDDLGGRTRQALQELRPALETFSTAAYGRIDAPLDRAELDTALSQGLDAVQRLRVGTIGPWRLVALVTRAWAQA